MMCVRRMYVLCCVCVYWSGRMYTCMLLGGVCVSEAGDYAGCLACGGLQQLSLVLHEPSLANITATHMHDMCCQPVLLHMGADAWGVCRCAIWLDHGHKMHTGHDWMRWEVSEVTNMQIECVGMRSDLFILGHLWTTYNQCTLTWFVYEMTVHGHTLPWLRHISGTAAWRCLWNDIIEWVTWLTCEMTWMSDLCRRRVPSWPPPRHWQRQQKQVTNTAKQVWEHLAYHALTYKLHYNLCRVPVSVSIWVLCPLSISVPLSLYVYGSVGLCSSCLHVFGCESVSVVTC